jgi:hypothetical protein
MRLSPLQQAIYDRLTAVSAITDAVTGVYTTAPQNVTPEDDSAFPYLTIGPIITTPSDDKDQNAVSALIDVHIWSRSQSALTWRAIGDDVYAALQRHDLSVTNTNVIDCRFEDSTEFQDPDDLRTWHSVLTFRVLMYEA